MTGIPGFLVGSLLALLAPRAFAESWSAISAPPAQSAHAAAWDSIGRQLVTFDGSTVQVLPDGAKQWTSVVAGGIAPLALRDFAWASDAAGQRLFIFGGRSATGVLHDETWVLHIGTPFRWETLGGATPKPSPRRDASLMHDPVADRLVLFAGKASTDLSDLWMLALAGTPAWVAVTETTTAVGPRSGHVAVYDPTDRRMLIYGGTGNPMTLSHLWSDVWALSLDSTPAWTRVFPSGGIPLGRTGAQAVFDAARRRMLVFAGTTEQGLTNEVLSLALDPSPAWQAALAPVPGEKSAGRAAAFDARDERVLLSGGTNTPTELNVLSVAPSPAWTQAGDWFEPPAETRAWVQAVYDSVHDRLTYFSTDWIWEASFATDPPTWTRSWISGTPPYSITSFAYDGVRNRVITVGEGMNDRLHILDLGTRAWSAPTATGFPSVPKSGRLAIDTRRDRLLLAVSNTSAGTPIYLPTDVWELPLTPPLVWNRLQEPSLPYVWALGEVEEQLLYDPIGDRLVMDGITGTPHLCYCLNQPSTRSLAFPSLEWTDQPTVMLPPQPDGSENLRFGSKVVLDPVGGRIVIGAVGGTGPNGDPPTVFGGWVSGLSPMLSWRELPGTDGPRVAHAVDEAGLAFDSRRNRLLVLGMGSLWSFQFDPPPPPPGVLCPGDRVWTPGVVDTLRYQVSNPGADAAAFEIRWTSDRAWPGFPRVQSVDVAAGGTRGIAWPLLTPDSVSAGSNRIAMSVRWRDHAAVATSCRTRIGDGSPPPPIVLLSAEVGNAFVRLVWSAPEMPEGVVNVERSASGTDWATVGVATVTAPDRLMFEDHPLASGRLYYRLSWFENESPRTNEPAAVDVPNPDLIVVGCPPDREWTPGAVDTLVYRIANPRPIPATLDLRWTSGRAWEPFPLTRLEALAVGEVRDIALPFVTPDTVIAGANRIAMSARWADQSTEAAACHTRIGDGSPPPPIVILGVEATPDRVRLVWSAPEKPAAEVIVQRSAFLTTWTRAGVAISTAPDRLFFEDHPDVRVRRWFYRLSWQGPGGPETSEIVTVDLPSAALSVRTRVPLAAGGIVRVAYALPGPGEATVELMSIAGRRMGLQPIGAAELRSGEIDLRTDAPLAPGVYALRLTHAGDRVASKVVVVR